MGKSNKRVKEELIRLFGPECFIEKLHLRPAEPRHYEGNAQYKRMKQLTYHHIKEKSKGGETSVRNGALLSNENHIWFNQQSKEKQAEMNQAFQDYKASFKICCASIQSTSEGLKVQALEHDTSIDIELPPEIQSGIIEVESMTPEEYAYYQEHKRKRNERIIAKLNKQKEENNGR